MNRFGKLHGWTALAFFGNTSIYVRRAEAALAVARGNEEHMHMQVMNYGLSSIPGLCRPKAGAVEGQPERPRMFVWFLLRL